MGFLFENISFPTIILAEWCAHSPFTVPPSPFLPLHDPDLPGHRVDEDTVMRVKDTTTGLEKYE